MITMSDVSEPPVLLLTNDDGIHATGLRVLAAQLADLGEVIVVAPDRERSAASHALTLNGPLRVDELSPGWFAVDGTPADCVYVSVRKICPRRPALVVSGINHGNNLGSDVFYSGTVAGAVEGALRDVPAMAISLEWSRGMRHRPDLFEPAARFAHALGRAMLSEKLPKGAMLNVNVPQAEPPRGYRFTFLGKRLYRDQVDERRDPRGRRYYWIGGPPLEGGDIEGSDGHAVRHGLVSVTPLDLDLTHKELLETLPAWHVEGFAAIVDRDLAEEHPPRPLPEVRGEDPDPAEDEERR
jgi:5'-nucleotidase